jgi:hypothetical protein
MVGLSLEGCLAKVVPQNKLHFKTVILALEQPNMVHLLFELWDILKPDTLFVYSSDNLI